MADDLGDEWWKESEGIDSPLFEVRGTVFQMCIKLDSDLLRVC